LVVNNGSSVSYAPNLNENGADSFTYTITDSGGLTSTATVNVTINPINDAPVAAGESYNVNRNATLLVLAPGVLGNDSDVDNAALSAFLVSRPGHASSFALNSDGSFSFVPETDYVGPDSFTYQAYDGAALSNAVTVNITVATEVVTDPVTPGGTVSTGTEPTADDPTETSVTSPGAGTITIAETSTSEVPTGAEASSYNFLGLQVNITAPVATPGDPLRLVFRLDSSVIPAGQNFNTVEVFRNGVLVPACTSEALAANPQAADPSPCVAGRELEGDNIKLTVLTAAASTWNFGIKKPELNSAPIAVVDNYAVDEDHQLTAATSVLGNDTDADGNTLTAILVSGPAHGSLNLNADGSFTYSPNGNFNGLDTFTYKANDGTADSSVAVVTITVSAVNDEPVALGQTASTNGNTFVSITLTGRDVETPSANLAYTVTSEPSHGSLSGTGANRIYTPANNYCGSDSFKFKVTDTGDGPAASLTSSDAIVSISVNDTIPPTINAPASSSANPDINCLALVPNLLPQVIASDSCSQVMLQQSPAAGTMVGIGRHTITVTATDGAGNSSTASTTFTVNAVPSFLLNVNPTSARRGGRVTLTAAFNNCATTNQAVSFKVNYTSACNHALIRSFGPITIHPGQHGSTSFNFDIPNNTCSGLYSLTLDWYVGGVRVESTTAQLMVTP
jgi:VCBS repeat-containing protein